ncbi:MAG: ATP-binding protein, partial [Proteobacteria bacterium]|nr:ATP-binding protein [Pseudomonadota bacterium]
MNDIYLGKGDREVYLLGKYANRHGLIAGATGTGKSVSLMVLAEGFSRLGVPVFLADVKGDLAGLSQPGQPGDKLQARLDRLGVTDWAAQASPVVFWDVYGQSGHPVRTTISEMGSTLLARVLELNDTQEGVLTVAFKVADDNGLLLLDLDDLRSMLVFVAENAKAVSARYGLVSTPSIGAIQRALLQLEQDGGARFFGEPALDLADFLRQDPAGRGIVNVLCAEQLIHKPRLYATFLLWMLSELFENLPEVGDVDLPRLVFFFDEAHLLFADAPDSLRQRIEQVVRLIRSKGVGVYFISQLPDDVPDQVLGQLGNRIQHALRAFTPRDQKAVRTAAETFPPNKRLNVVEAITQLGVGEALVTTLQEGGVPLPVERATIAPPRCRIGAITDQERASVRKLSPIGNKYDAAINRESAHEMLQLRAAAAASGAVA